METFREIIDRWPKPSLQTFADDIGVVYVTAQLMRYRSSISSTHWDAVVAGAKRRGIDGVSLELLASIKSQAAVRKCPPKRRAYQPAA